MTRTSTSEDPINDQPVRNVLRGLALKARGMSGADVERLVRQARQKARQENSALSYGDLDGLLTQKIPYQDLELRRVMAIHEAGHAVVRLALDIGTILSISINALCGGLLTSDNQASGPQIEAWFTTRLVIQLAGRAAEEEVLGYVTAGSGGSEESDLAQATRLALAMETRLGFASASPLLYQPVEDASHSMLRNAELATRINERLEDAYEKARIIVRANGNAITFLADRLQEYGTLEGDDLASTLADVRERMTSQWVTWYSDHGLI